MENKDYLKCNSRIKYLFFLIVYFFLYIPSFVLYHKKCLWLICERGTDAQDNGFKFYKYLKTNQAGIKLCYIIKKDSPDISKLDKKDIVLFGGLKHFMLCIGCKVQISSHLFGYCPWTTFMLYLRKHKTRNVHVFLQHGITYNNQYGFYKKVCKALDIYICGSSYEQDFVCSTFGYSKDEAVLTGFARFDDLHQGLKKTRLVIMPTWRRYLTDVNRETFVNSSYYRAWHSFLNNPDLINICSTHKLELTFYLHSSLQPYLKTFDDLKNVTIVKYGDITVQDLLKESAVLITDYSSVFFDCLYMNKSVLLYQFDKDDFIKEHYSEGYLDELDASFITIEKNEYNIVKDLREILSNQNKDRSIMLSKFSNDFFGLKDQSNCNRIYNTILSKL